MPYSNSWEENVLYRKFTGIVSGDEVFESNIKIQADPRFLAIKGIINDFTEIEAHAINESFIEAYVIVDDIGSNIKAALKIALVIVRHEDRPLAESYCEQMRDKRFECRIFSNLEDARHWVLTGKGGI